MKQCKPNPWDEFAENYKKGDHVTGKIKSITDFGIFIGLDGGIDGLVHLSDISWDDTGEDAIRNYKKGQELETVVLSVDPERERISLGMWRVTSVPPRSPVTAWRMRVPCSRRVKRWKPSSPAWTARTGS